MIGIQESKTINSQLSERYNYISHSKNKIVKVKPIKFRNAVCKIKLEKIKKAICDRLLSIPNQKKGNHK